MPVFWTGLLVVLASGLLLLVAYPTKALTNPVFYLKMACIVLAVACVRRAERVVLRNAPRGSPRVLALPLVVLITGGRYLAYTYTRLTVDFARGI